MTASPIGRYPDAAPARRLRSMLAPSLATAKSVTLSVTHGFHAGAELILVEPLYTIGSSTESDVVLRDAGIAPIHARLRRKGSQFEIEAVGGDVALATGEIIRQGQGSRCRLPIILGIGDARIRLVNPERPPNRLSIGNRPVLVAGSVLFAVFAVSVAANGFSLAKSDIRAQTSSSHDGQVKMAFAGERGRDALDDSSPAQIQTVAEAESQLKLRLDRSGINTVTVQRSPGRLVVSGMIPSDKSRVWTETQSWFDEAFGTRVPLVSNVMVGNAPQAPRLTLQAIWYGERPYVIAADGARYHEGAFTDDGWTIKHIGETELLLTKGGATVALKYP
ncbi:EscD/YscD/HrpQ family type III secretion system periplasmic domain-containing protein [Mesorhizobium sp. WSM4884]|uniref:SctD/MshK family protein n=1 Tax=Mesorhizobium sp. WSM4884 TaxID=3038542 RepID=UPI0024169136|nr:EscD/YscD/HrpQ family type III secretion system periplasmic domain-containing protein [Mesorhizobium sp. WSM4884]MDG4884031.1 EscD/YscD/HrpQ family type III secretion system periplasmic domain-containing protein [Mesorhizobium sp. WSM4884]